MINAPDAQGYSVDAQEAPRSRRRMIEEHGGINRSFWDTYKLKRICSFGTFSCIANGKISVRALSLENWKRMAKVLGSDVDTLQSDCLHRLYCCIGQTPLCRYLTETYGHRFGKNGDLAELLEHDMAAHRHFCNILLGHFILEWSGKTPEKCIGYIARRYSEVTMDVAFPEQYHNRALPRIPVAPRPRPETEPKNPLVSNMPDVFQAFLKHVREVSAAAGLTHREQCVVRKRLEGMSTRKLASQYHCSPQNILNEQNPAIAKIRAIDPALADTIVAFLAQKGSRRILPSMECTA